MIKSFCSWYSNLFDSVCSSFFLSSSVSPLVGVLVFFLFVLHPIFLILHSTASPADENLNKE